MKKDIYKKSMDHIRFNTNFEEEVIRYCENKNSKKERILMKRFIPVAGALAAILCLIAVNNIFIKAPANIPNNVNTDSSINELNALYVKNFTLNNHQAEYKLLTENEAKSLDFSTTKGKLLTETTDGMKVYQIADRNDLVYILINDELYQFFRFTGEDGNYGFSDILSIYGIQNPDDIKEVIVKSSNPDESIKDILLTDADIEMFYNQLLTMKSLKEEEFSKQIEDSGYQFVPGDEFKERTVQILTSSGETLVLNYNPLNKYLTQGGYAFFDKLEDNFNSWLIKTAEIDISADYSNKIIDQNMEGEAASKILEWVNTNGYPDYYAGVYLNDNGKVVVLLTDDSATNKDEIRKIASSTDIIFQKAIHSYNYLTEIQNKISEKMQNGEFSFISSSGIMEDKNYIEVGIVSASDSEIDELLKLDPTGSAIKVVDSGNLSIY
ncbi:hypothetical protein EDD66_107163 [Mobilisporobacter senegalensis]|uniref:Uncharacterized protein n=1 Tax=Mobilisporobacter senegalensis TaxID=1329262 RepID=A0A3N1XKK8_9FIRM|nr:hypothetical protein [Mobilisporobacter senegalensis]ROR27249.1 hypothetical protein EDD66_107163 [Mobilisporobacter senegalensis]